MGVLVCVGVRVWAEIPGDVYRSFVRRVTAMAGIYMYIHTPCSSHTHMACVWCMWEEVSQSERAPERERERQGEKRASERAAASFLREAKCIAHRRLSNVVVVVVVGSSRLPSPPLPQRRCLSWQLSAGSGRCRGRRRCHRRTMELDEHVASIPYTHACEWVFLPSVCAPECPCVCLCADSHMRIVVAVCLWYSPSPSPAAPPFL